MWSWHCDPELELRWRVRVGEAWPQRTLLPVFIPPQSLSHCCSEILAYLKNTHWPGHVSELLPSLHPSLQPLFSAISSNPEEFSLRGYRMDPCLSQSLRPRGLFPGLSPLATRRPDYHFILETLLPSHWDAASSWLPALSSLLPLPLACLLSPVS